MNKIKWPKLMKLDSDTDDEPVHPLMRKFFGDFLEKIRPKLAEKEPDIIPADYKNPINPEHFVSRMESHWTDELGNVGSEALRATWRQIAVYFNKQIKNHDTEDSRKWYALSPPTGSGKTQGTIIYCSMLADLENYEHPAVLIVTLRKKDAEYIAEQINKFGGRETAIAFHSGEMSKKVKINDLPTYPVLVICHEAYKKAVGLVALKGDIVEGKWPWLSKYHIGHRKLTIIDECIDLVEDAGINLDGLRETFGMIPQRIRDRHPQDIAAMKKLIDVLEGLHGLSSKDDTPMPDFMFTKIMQVSSDPLTIYDFKRLVHDLQKENFDPTGEHQKRLSNLAQMYRDWSYYSKHGKDHTLKSARMLLPKDGIQGAVVMDATASANRVYSLHKEIEIIDPPKGSRNYRNFTLYISKGHQVGKGAMKNIGHKQIPDLMRSLNPELKGKDVLVISHLISEHHIDGCKSFVDFNFEAAHWQNLDGSNDWKDCQAVVLASLPYLPDDWGNNRYMAFKGEQDNDWLQGEDGIEQRLTLRRGKLASDIIQALNRVQSRKVINDEGDCPETIGFMLLGKVKNENDSLIRDIRKLMPDIKIKTFNFQKQQKTLETNKERILLKFLENTTSGEHHRKDIENITKISSSTMTRMIKKIKEPESKLNRELEKLNVLVETRRQGRSFKTFFVKRNST
jgi:hypothetical protein